MEYITRYIATLKQVGSVHIMYVFLIHTLRCIGGLSGVYALPLDNIDVQQNLCKTWLKLYKEFALVIVQKNLDYPVPLF